MHQPDDGGIPAQEREWLAAARAGQEAAFEALTLPLQRELHVHCYRMLGSFADADDALQETLLNAWRGIDRFEPRAPFRAWMYRIATNVCLTMLGRRSRRDEVTMPSLSTSHNGEGEMRSLDPYPDRLLDGLMPAGSDPEATVEVRESVELAFVAAVQFLPPRQRATLLLRDVMGYSAVEVADMLVTTTAGVNSAHQRARANLARERALGRIARGHVAGDPDVEAGLVRRLVAAWHASDIPSITAVLTEDALVAMPPEPERYIGRDAIARFLAVGPGGGRLDRFRLVPTRANRQPALAAYYRDADTGPYHAHAVFMLAIDDGAITSLTRLLNPGGLAPFGLPESILA